MNAMPAFPVDVLDGVLDYAAIGISAIAAIGTLVAVGVAIWQTNRAQTDARVARAESEKLRNDAASQAERHHQEIVEIQKAAREFERTLRLDTLARDAARESGAERIRFGWKLLTNNNRSGEWIQFLIASTAATPMISARIFVDAELVSWKSGDAERTMLSIPAGDTKSISLQLNAAQIESIASGSFRAELEFYDPLSNRWRIDQLNRLFLYAPRFIGIDAAHTAETRTR